MSGFIGSLPPNSAPVVSFIPICDIAESATGNAMEATIGAGSCVIACQSVNAQPRSKADRKSVGEGTSVSLRVDLGGRRFINKHKVGNADDKYIAAEVQTNR